MTAVLLIEDDDNLRDALSLALPPLRTRGDGGGQR